MNMKRKLAILLAALMLLSAAACAEMPSDISEALFVAVKQAVVDMANGDFEQAACDLTFSEIGPAAEDLQTFASGFTMLSSDTVQSEICVAYWSNDGWMLAVPVMEPIDGEVETMVFSSLDGKTLGGCCLILWSEVEAAYDISEYVLWNQEYIPAQLIIIADGTN